MARVSIAAAETEAVEVDLWGTVFTTVPVTRSRQRAIKELDTEFAALDDSVEDAEDQAVRLMAGMLDHMLAPEPGKRKKPSDLIVAKWQSDDLTFRQLERLFDDLTEAVNRPT